VADPKILSSVPGTATLRIALGARVITSIKTVLLAFPHIPFNSVTERFTTMNKINPVLYLNTVLQVSKNDKKVNAIHLVLS